MSDPRRLVEEGDLGASLLSSALVLDADQARARKAALLGVAASGTAAVALGAATKVLPNSFAAALFTKSVATCALVAVVSGGTIGAIALARSEPKEAAAPLIATSGRGLRAAEARAPRAPTGAPSAPLEVDLAVEAPSPPSVINPAVEEPSAPSAPVLTIDSLPSVTIAPVVPRAASTASALAGSAGARAAGSPRAAAELPVRNEAPEGAASPGHLAEEVALLQQARTALGEGQPARALTALDTHAQRFSRGLLGIEAEVLRIEALSRSGNASAASERARRFIASHPNTPYARRVQALSGEDHATP